MKCPTLEELPPPPAGKTGWPWTSGSGLAPAGGETLPKIGIVTPSYMQGRFLEETIRSVLLQGYPDVEYIIVDGGSRDGSKAIIEKYAPWLTWWCCEKDGGQPDAINKGLRRLSAGIVAFINSDDWYHPGAFMTIGRRAAAHPHEDWWAGGVENRDGEQRVLKTSSFTTLPRFLGRVETLYQPGVFWSARMLRAVPTFDATLQYLFDHDYWIRAYDCGFRPIFIDVPLANFRLHGESKSCSRQHFQMRELWQVTRARRSSLSEADWKMIKEWVRSYEASNLLTSVYSLLATGRRASAADYLLRSMPLYGYLSPARLILGAFYRTFITGRPPKWFRQ